MKFIRIVVIGFFLVLIFSDNVQSQDSLNNAKEYYLKFSPGWRLIKIRDRFTSPLVYSGNAILGYAGFEQNKPNVIERNDLYFHYGMLSPDESTAKIKNMKAAIDYMNLRKIGNYSHIDWFAGGVWNNAYSLRWHQSYQNNSFSYDFFSSLGISAMARYPFHIKKYKFHVGFWLSVPLVAYSVRPSLVKAYPEKLLTKNSPTTWQKFIAGEFVFFNRYQRVQNGISVTWYLKNGNGIRLRYLWNFYHFDQINELHAASHSLSIVTLLNL